MWVGWRGWFANLNGTNKRERSSENVKERNHKLFLQNRNRPLAPYGPRRALHVVSVARSLLVNVTAGPRGHLPQRVHHGRVGPRVGALEALVPVGGRNDAAALGGMLLHAHVRLVRGVALRNVLKQDKDIIS